MFGHERTSTERGLLNRSFLLLWQGQFVSRLGTQVASLVMLLWVAQATGSATLTGLLALVSSLPTIVFGIIGGSFADRYSRRVIISVSDLISGVAMLLLGALFALRAEDSDLLAAGIIVASVFAAIADAFSNPAISAAIPDIVPRKEITKANSIVQMGFQLSTLLGQGMGGILFRAIGPLWVALSSGVAYLYAGVTESFMRIPQQPVGGAAGLRHRLNELRADTALGFRTLRDMPGLRDLVVVSSIQGFFSAPLIVFIPTFYVLDHLKLSEDWAGFLAAGFGVGAIIGAVAAGAFHLSGRARGRALLGILIVSSVGFAVLGLLQGPVEALVLVAIGGALQGAAGVYVVTIVQMSVSADVRGRIFGFLGTLSGAVAPAGMALGGVFFDWIGHDILLMFGLCGLIMTVATVFLSTSKNLRAYLSQEYETEASAQPEPHMEVT